MTSTPRSARSTLPFLPGYTAHDLRFNSRKPQTLSWGPGGSTDAFHKLKQKVHKVPTLNLAIVEKLRDPFHRYDMSYRSPTHDEKSFMRESARNTYRPAIPPAWLQHDRQVLKFSAYSQEPVYESPKEAFRIRCCNVYFYLEDGTMMVSEPKVENSGMSQGTWIKRHRLPKPECMGGGLYTCDDLRVGCTISIYSQLFRLVACDQFTRDFYQHALGVEMEADEDAPLDSFRASEIEDNAPETKALIAARSARLAESKEYHHLSAGGNRKNAKLEQYLENDRKVLRFNCYWNDHTKYGTRQYYTLHYYLADDTAEILENMSRNSGRDPYPTFWRRSPLRKSPNISAIPGMDVESVVYKPEDLLIGECVQVLGRDVFLYDCDSFTRDFYRQFMNLEQDSIPIENPQLVHTKLRFPPHIGFGSEEDSLASCLRLRPRPPQRDMKKLIADAEKVMRFEAVLVNSIPQDQKRRFVVAVFLADTSIGVWEFKNRNSGHTEGKFANKARRKNPMTRMWFRQSDFFVGATIEVNASPFRLIWADDAAFNYMEEHADEFPRSNVDVILSKIAPFAEDLRKVPGIMEWKDLQALAKEMDLHLVDQEVIALARAFGTYQGHPKCRATIDVSRVVSALQ
ncbi:efhc2 [Symbiodinium pilosum]|uniref:Efhc2 protein n=1 Tax=Symbiodinium pilosum TaxID=2952 RepID=A0A812JX57_SYMPI|nr:efhc2 [Symbiodinium pilosum]